MATLVPGPGIRTHLTVACTLCGQGLKRATDLARHLQGQHAAISGVAFVVCQELKKLTFQISDQEIHSTPNAFDPKHLVNIMGSIQLEKDQNWRYANATVLTMVWALLFCRGRCLRDFGKLGDFCTFLQGQQRTVTVHL